MKQILRDSFFLLFSGYASKGRDDTSTGKGTMVQIESNKRQYPAYLATPAGGKVYPAVVMIHSFKGLEQGYRDMADRFAAEGYVVIAPEWQTYGQSPGDTVVEELVRDTLSYLTTRNDVDRNRLGLTGFCAGGRYTMLLLPRIGAFRSGVAFYGFPYSGGGSDQTPASLISDLKVPMLIIHGSADSASPIAGIYQYATELDAAGKYFELKVYQGEPHGFMVQDGQLAGSFVAQDAYAEMSRFFARTLT
jgi:carboxymethylenebutenolidase